MGKIVVTCVDGDGRSRVMNDLAPVHMGVPGLFAATAIWQAAAIPNVPLSSSARPVGEGFASALAPGATRFALVEFLPGETKSAADLAGAEHAGDLQGAFATGQARHASMHQTDTLEYCVIVAGELVLILDDEDVVLRAGDILVQGGVRHGWANRSGGSATMLGVQIGAVRV